MITKNISSLQTLFSFFIFFRHSFDDIDIIGAFPKSFIANFGRKLIK